MLVLADNGTQYQEKLDKVQRQITAIQQAITQRQSQRGKVDEDLRQSELQIAAIAKRLRKASTATKAAQSQLDLLSARAEALELTLKSHRTTLRKQIRAAYQSSRTPRIQLLLNQRDPALLSRMLAYYDAFNRARQQQIAQSLALLEELDSVHRAQKATVQKRETARAALQSEQTQMQTVRKQRRSTLAKLEKKLASDKSQLTQLQQNQRDLESLLEQLNAALADIPPPPLERKPFKSMRGKLPWPAVGSLKARYNSTKGAADLRWKGMFIGAKPGNNVRAIYHGQVAFSDWMNGFGLILIIDHGDGYMSIYANCQSLYKSQGEWVTPGEIIATIGDSGGQKRSGVYFEMRRKGAPINPHRWVKKSIKFVSIQ